MRLCIVGIGNTWASDDAVGPKVVRRLQNQPPPISRQPLQQTNGDEPEAEVRPVVIFQTLAQPPVELLDLMEHCDILIVVDAVISGAPPGTIHRHLWSPDLLSSRGQERASSHGLGLREMLELAAKLEQLPAKVVLFGIEIKSTELGHGLSAEVAEALPQVVEQLRREIEQLF
jgi:hydrogenase maturation protease